MLDTCSMRCEINRTKNCAGTRISFQLLRVPFDLKLEQTCGQEPNPFHSPNQLSLHQPLRVPSHATHQRSSNQLPQASIIYFLPIHSIALHLSLHQPLGSRSTHRLNVPHRQVYPDSNPVGASIWRSHLPVH